MCIKGGAGSFELPPLPPPCSSTLPPQKPLLPTSSRYSIYIYLVEVNQSDVHFPSLLLPQGHLNCRH